ncbi:MAG: metallophosphoesterase [Erysipelotrichaceae bacterium]|nr:metallophosphoesterase [Erysipelotrichaceae bacterium]MDD3923645.1 metallophosphoesterase [Erysipelotrichaceae bacterium]MDD4642000.1 metallophosphoesterase [Erysipelotrichaceae bacterium]
MKKLKHIAITIFIILILTSLFFYYDARFKAIHRLDIRFELIINEKVPDSFNNTQILIFSDIYYNSFMDKERFEKIVDTINQSQPDIVIFLGDLFNNPTINPPTAQIQEELMMLLNEIDAPLGKFAIYGDQDLQSQTTKQIFDSIMTQANFEILSNTNLMLTNHDNLGIRLIALNNIINGNFDIDQAYENTDNKTYTLAICHTPDIIDYLKNNVADLFISGHSLGGQIYIPFYGSLVKMDGALNYSRGKQKVANTLLDITNGLGTTKYDLRLFTDPEIVIYEFSNQ